MKHNIFAIEPCLRLEPEDRLRAQLRELVAGHPSGSTPGYKWEQLRRAAELLLRHQDLFEKGCWDFFDDDDRARRDYEMWCNGMITEEGARQQPSGRPAPVTGRRTTAKHVRVDGGPNCVWIGETDCSIPARRASRSEGSARPSGIPSVERLERPSLPSRLESRTPRSGRSQPKKCPIAV